MPPAGFEPAISESEQPPTYALDCAATGIGDVVAQRTYFQLHTETSLANFYVLLTVHLSISLDNDQLDTHLLYFTIRLL